VKIETMETHRFHSWSCYELAAGEIAEWICAGRLKYREDMHEGLESAPASIRKLYSGENSGKLIIRL
jgi:NADPH-dependent curcumin reductase CurA